MSTEAISPLRQRMIEDMNARKLSAQTQRGHIRSCKRFAAFLKRSPDTATAEDIRLFQLHLIESGLSIRLRPRRNPHSCGTTAVPNPRFPALALFGRRPSECVERPSFRRPKTCTKHKTCTNSEVVRFGVATPIHDIGGSPQSHIGRPEN
jgi:hypothetical protein